MVKRNWRRRKFLTKKKNVHKLFFLIVVGMTLGFAAITTTLQLVGTLNIARTTWNIHWANPTKTGGVTAAQDAQLKTGDSTTVEYQVNLANQGEYYEFTVDAQNEGTIDAMVTGFENKVYENSVEVQKPDYLDFTVTYADGTTITNNHLLAAGNSETYKVKVEYKNNLTADQLPTQTKTYKFTFKVTYMQSDENAESTIIFDNQNATTPGTTTIAAKYNQPLTAITPPTKTGSTFSGYYDNVNARELSYMVQSYDAKRINFYETGYYTPNNGWAMTAAGDEGVHINGKFSTTSNIVSMDFNDIALDETQYTITEDNGTYTVYVDFDITAEMLTPRSYNYDVKYRFIDVYTSNSITIDYMIKDGKKYYDSTGNGLINYDSLSNKTLYAKWE